MGPGSIAASVRSVFSGESQPGRRGSVFSFGYTPDVPAQPDQADKSSIDKSNETQSGRTGVSGRTDEDDASNESEAVSDDESDDEAVFAYSRVTGLPPTFFRKDQVSAAAVSNEIHVYATHSGLVHLKKAAGEPLRTVRVHRSSVLDVSIDSSGEFVASASIDGTVMVASVAEAGDTVQASFRRPVHAVALHPSYRTTRSYISGGTAGQILLSEPGWLKARADTVLARTTSTILALMWTVDGLLWCNEDGITVYDLDSRSVRATIPRTSSDGKDTPADLLKPRVFAASRSTAIVSWATTVFSVDMRTGELLRKLELPYTVAGAVPFHDAQLAVLAVTPDAEPELRLISALNGSESYADELEMNNSGGHRAVPNDYHLLAPQRTGNTPHKSFKSATGDGELKVWIVSSLDAVEARERNARDHLDWLIDHSKFIEAYQAAKTATRFEPSWDERIELGLKAAQQLVDNQSFEAAAFVLPEVLDPGSVDDWTPWARQFVAEDAQLVLGDILPPIHFEDNFHDTILRAAVERGDNTRLRTWVKRWPLDVFDATLLGHLLAVILGTSPAEESDMTQQLRLVYADLLVKTGEHVRAVDVLVAADSPRAFQIANHYHLWTEPDILNQLSALLEAGIDESDEDNEKSWHMRRTLSRQPSRDSVKPPAPTGYVERLRALIGARAEISPSRVAQQLQTDGGHDMLLFGYLSELRLVDETLLAEKPLVDLMVELYAKFDRQKLLGFLEKFDSYDIEASIKMCRKQNLVNELVYLLGRMGQSNEALSLIVKELRDYERAVTFARTQDPEIWDTLIEYASESPGLVVALLKCVEVSPAQVLARVPADMQIPGLKATLCRLLNGQEVSVAMHQGALHIVHNEFQQWNRLLNSARLAGTLATDDDLRRAIIEDSSPHQNTQDPSKEVHLETNWKDIPVMLNEKNGVIRYERVEPFDGDVSTFSGKINHLSWLLAQH